MARPKRDGFDKATLATAIVGIVVAVATLIMSQLDQASSGRETARAIAGIETMASAMANQVGVMEEEKPNIAKQANAAADSAAAAKTTAALAEGQTQAVLRQAEALIESARSTSKAAAAQLEGAQASIKTASAGLKAAEEQRQSAALFASTRAPIAELASVDFEGWPTTGTIAQIVPIRITVAVKNIGGGSLRAGPITFSLAVSKSLPPPQSLPPQHTFGGNETYVEPGTTYGNVKSTEYRFTKADIDDVTNGMKSVFVWGVISYKSASNIPYKTCYVMIARPPTSDYPSSIVRLNEPAYSCEALGLAN